MHVTDADIDSQSVTLLPGADELLAGVAAVLAVLRVSAGCEPQYEFSCRLIAAAEVLTVFLAELVRTHRLDAWHFVHGVLVVNIGLSDPAAALMVFRFSLWVSTSV